MKIHNFFHCSKTVGMELGSGWQRCSGVHEERDPARKAGHLLHADHHPQECLDILSSIWHMQRISIIQCVHDHHPPSWCHPAGQEAVIMKQQQVAPPRALGLSHTLTPSLQCQAIKKSKDVSQPFTHTHHTQLPRGQAKGLPK